MATILIHGQNFTYTIQKQKRKTLQLQLIAPYTLLIKSPQNLTVADILIFINKKATWIFEKNCLLQQQLDQKNRLALATDSSIPFMGKQYTLNVIQSSCKPSIKKDSAKISINLYNYTEYEFNRLIERWYLHQASIILREKTTYWSTKISVTFKNITIKDQKTRWGSCSSLGNINYNWRIIMAPEEIIDYLVIHELCHRIHLNHSKDFWNLVEKFCPSYLLHKKWLKEHSYDLLHFSFTQFKITAS